MEKKHNMLHFCILSSQLTKNKRMCRKNVVDKIQKKDYIIMEQ